MINEWTENLNQAIKAKETISKRSELTGDVLCRACGYALGRLENLRQNGPAYFVYDQDFYDRIEEKMYPEPEEFGRTLVTGIPIELSSIIFIDFCFQVKHYVVVKNVELNLVEFSSSKVIQAYEPFIH